MNDLSATPTREEMSQAAAIFDRAYGELQETKAALQAAHDRIAELQGSVNTLQAQLDDRDQRIFELEQDYHLHIIEREGVVTNVGTAMDAIVRAHDNITKGITDEIERRASGMRTAPTISPDKLSAPQREKVLSRLAEDLNEPAEGQAEPSPEDNGEPIPTFLRRDQ